MFGLGLLLLAGALLYRLRSHVTPLLRFLLRSSGRMLIATVILSLAVNAPRSPMLALGLFLITIALLYRYRALFGPLFAPFFSIVARALGMIGSLLHTATRIRLRLLLLVAAVACGVVLLISYGLPYIRDLAASSSDLPVSFRFGVSLIGFTLGYVVGLRLQHTERSSPVFFGLASAVVFFMAAKYLLWLAVAGFVVVALIFLGRNVWPTIHDATLTFASSAGTRFRPRSPDFPRQLARLQHEHERRTAAIRALGLDADKEGALLEEEQQRYIRALHTLSAGSGDTRDGGPFGNDIQGWFDPPQGGVE